MKKRFNWNLQFDFDFSKWNPKKWRKGYDYIISNIQDIFNMSWKGLGLLLGFEIALNPSSTILWILTLFWLGIDIKMELKKNGEDSS